MHVLITLAGFRVGGSETYTLTVAEQLEVLGHRVTVYAPQATDAGAELAAARKIALVTGPAPPLDGVDAVLSQDGASACMIASRRSELRQVFVTHGLTGQERLPAQLRPTPPVVVLNDRMAGYVAAGAPRPKLIRLHQPIDLMRYKARGPTNPRARRVLALGNYLEESRRDMLDGVCRELDLELVQLGASSTTKINPEVAIAEVDIVVGYGRVVLEAMAMGRAAYVWDYKGGDGWVTPESYPALESSGFNGAATGAIIDADRLRSDLSEYRPELGQLGADLVALNHSAAIHTEHLVELLESSESPAPADGLEAMAVLIRTEARAAERAFGLDHELRRVIVEREELRERAIEATRRIEQDRDRADRKIEEERRRAERAEAGLAEVLGSRSWRLTEPLRTGRLRRGRR
ncbi:MAG TPA: hypothetical protein VHB53_07320 [Solirubrobacterales bacterium]|nr:hypothetical protein [Solirubrobacterales bacterium]